MVEVIVRMTIAYLFKKNKVMLLFKLRVFLNNRLQPKNCDLMPRFH